MPAFHGKRKNLTVDSGFQTCLSRLKLIAKMPSKLINGYKFQFYSGDREKVEVTV